MEKNNILSILDQKGIHLTPEQAEGLSLDETPRLLLAVPGSGKTTVLVSRVAAQLYSGIPAGKILNITFSRESARDMAARFSRLFPECTLPRFSTVHSLCYSILARYAAENGRIVPTLTGSDNAPTSSQLLREAIRRSDREDKDAFIDEEDIADALSCIGLIKNRMLSRSEMGNVPCVLSGLPELYDGYEAVKSEKGLMDYDDILLYALTFLRRLPGILSHFRALYPYINVDEAQDISKTQLEVIRLLSPEGRRLFMVGDEDQSIYGFRGAFPEGILSFEKLFPGGKIFRMEDNFRTRPEILSHCERFIRLNRERYDKSLRPTRDAREKTVFSFRPQNPERAMERILSAVSALTPGETLGILYRNNLSAFPAADLLLQAGVPFTITPSPVTLIRYQAAAVAGIMRLGEDSFDREAFSSLPGLDLDKRVKEELLRQYDGTSDFTSDFPALLIQRGEEKSRKLGKILRELHGLSPSDALDLICRELKTGKFFLAKALGKDDPAGALRSSIFRQFTRRCGTVPELFERIGRVEALTRSAVRPEGARVHLTTIHSAKGLEFDHVLLLDCCEGILPGRISTDQLEAGKGSAAYYEEVRLFYVAATRARETLTLFAPAVSDKGLLPSRFLSAFLEEETPEKTDRPGILFRTGERVRHKTLGEGMVVSVNGDLLSIAFTSDGKSSSKTLSASFCCGKGLLEKL